MKYLRFYQKCILFFLILCVIKTAEAVKPSEDPLKSDIMSGIELTINNEFNEALHVFQRLIRAYPRHPVGYFYKGATIQASMLDTEDYSHKKDFYAVLDSAIFLANRLKDNGSQDEWTLFFEGSAYLYKSFMKSKQGSWFSAYRDAVRGADRLQKAIEMDSTIYDARLGLGSFKYWKSARAGFLLWLPILSDEKDSGIKMIKEAIQKGYFVRWVGRDQLCWVYLDNGQNEEALNLAKENYLAYPKSRFFKWTLVEAAYRSNKLDLSYNLYQELLHDVRELEDNNHYNELECLVRLAEIDFLRGNYHQTFRYADKALRLNLNEDIRKRAKKKLNRALKLRTEVASYD